VIRTFAVALPELEAREQLAAIEAASVPHMDARGHRETLSRLLAVLGADVKPAKATAADLASIGIQVEHVPKAVS
jgi:hypothetical protein